MINSSDIISRKFGILNSSTACFYLELLSSLSSSIGINSFPKIAQAVLYTPLDTLDLGHDENAGSSYVGFLPFSTESLKH